MALYIPPVPNPLFGTQPNSERALLDNIRNSLEHGQIRAAAEFFANLDVDKQLHAFELLCEKFPDKCTYGNVVRDGVDLVFDDPSRLLALVDGVAWKVKDFDENLQAVKERDPKIIDCLLLPHVLMKKPQPSSSEKRALPGSADETTQQLEKIIAEKKQLGIYRPQFHKQRLFTFLTTNDNNYNLNRDYDFSIEDVFGVLWFDQKNNPQDKAFLHRINDRQYCKSAFKAFGEAPDLSCHKFLTGNTRLANNDIAEILTHDWGTKRDAVYRFFKEVVKHCIIRNEGKGTTTAPRQTSRSSQQQSPNDLLLDFFRGVGANSDGVYLNQILNDWDDEKLEDDHHFIQWIFPSMKASDHNTNAPVLKNAPDIVRIFRADDGCKGNLAAAFDRILKFYGLEYKRSVISRVPGHRLGWLNKPHNFKRITRILGSLKNLGLENSAVRFMVILEDIAKKEGKGKIPEKSLEMWRKAVR